MQTWSSYEREENEDKEFSFSIWPIFCLVKAPIINGKAWRLRSSPSKTICSFRSRSDPSDILLIISMNQSLVTRTFTSSHAMINDRATDVNTALLSLSPSSPGALINDWRRNKDRAKKYFILFTRRTEREFYYSCSSSKMNEKGQSFVFTVAKRKRAGENSHSSFLPFFPFEKVHLLVRLIMVPSYCPPPSFLRHSTELKLVLRHISLDDNTTIVQRSSGEIVEMVSKRHEKLRSELIENRDLRTSFVSF